MNLQQPAADFCMIHKVLGSVCCCLFGKIPEILAHYFGGHFQMVTSRLHVSVYLMSQISTFSNSQLLKVAENIKLLLKSKESILKQQATCLKYSEK